MILNKLGLRVVLFCFNAISIFMPFGFSAIDESLILKEYIDTEINILSPGERPKVGLVLGGGGARGLAHIGVLKVLTREKIPVDIIVGTSIGALIGSLYAAGVPISVMERMSEEVGWNHLTNVSFTSLVFLFTREQLLSTEQMERYIARKIGNRRFDELPVKFACIAADLKTGERIIFREGPVAPAVRASATVPGVFKPVEYRHRYLIDGGVVDNLPADVAKMLGADIVLAVNVAGELNEFAKENVLLTLSQTIMVQSELLLKEQKKLADVVINPQVGDVNMVEIWRSKQCIAAGIKAATEQLPEIKNVIINRTFDRIFLGK